MPRIPRFGRPGALKIRQPPATQAPAEPPTPQMGQEGGTAAPQAPDGTAAHPAGAATAPGAVPDAPAPLPDAPAAAPASPAPFAAPEAAATVPPASAAPAPPPADPSFRERASMRRRLRFLRSARELALRDLGGLVFELQRLGRSREDLTTAKLATLGRIDSELRVLERALGEREPVTVLHAAGIAACRRCAAIHGSDARFCPHCGLPVGRRVHMPMAAPSIAAEASPTPAETESAPAEAGAPAPASPEASPEVTTALPALEEPGGTPGPAAAAPAAAAAAAPADGGGSEQPTRVVETVAAEDGEPSTR